MSSNSGIPKNINFPFGTNGKLMVLGVPILKHFRVDILAFIGCGDFIRVYGGGWGLNYNRPVYVYMAK